MASLQTRIVCHRSHKSQRRAQLSAFSGNSYAIGADNLATREECSCRHSFPAAVSTRLFLLSPARLDGLRAKQLMSPRAMFAAAMQYRTEAGVEVADAFAFMSALYFRGKIAYARQFAVPSQVIGGNGIFVITSGYGLVTPGWCLTEER